MKVSEDISKEQVSVESAGEVFTLFKSALSQNVVQLREREAGVKRYRNREPVFTTLVVLWLMIYQRLNPSHTQSSAVRELQSGRFSKLSTKSWRRKSLGISLSTSAYNQARYHLPVSLVLSLVEVLVENLLSIFADKYLWHGHRVFMLDGTGFSASRANDIPKHFPPTSNQHKGGYWSSVFLLSAHELFTGIALTPVWGSMYGSKAISEQKLSKKLLKRFPANSIAVGDANFGTFATVWHAQKNNVDSVVRLTPVRAKKILADSNLTKSKTANVVWKLSGHDRRNNTEIDKDATIKGKVIFAKVAHPRQRKNKFVKLILFTTLDYPEKEIVALYLKRWNIELDLKSIKCQMQMSRLTSKSKNMIEKEILTGFAAFSLVRATMALAAHSHSIEPRKLSFSNCLEVIIAHADNIQRSKSFRQIKEAIQNLLKAIAQSKIRRTKKVRKNQARFLRPCRKKYPIFMRKRKNTTYTDIEHA